MKDNLGVPASPSGHSATPEPVVSALRASVLNARVAPGRFEAILLAICVFGAFSSPAFADNLLERIIFGGLGIYCAAIIWTNRKRRGDIGRRMETKNER